MTENEGAGFFDRMGAVMLRRFPRVMRFGWVITVAIIGAVGVISGVVGEPTEPVLIVVAAFLVLTTLWIAAASAPQPEVALPPAMMIGALSWVWLLISSGGPNVGFALLMPLVFAVAARKARWYWSVATSAVLLAALFSAATAEWLSRDAFLPEVVAPTLNILAIELVTFLTLAFTAAFFRHWEGEKELERERALSQERLRFSADLHDLQGHSLLAIKFKVELARRSLDRDIDRTRAELASVERLLREMETHTRQLVYGFRDTNLIAELENLKELLLAAGAQVKINGSIGTVSDWGPAYAAFLREAASNILRHSQARLVEITLAPSSVTIRNDGALDEAKQLGTGQGLQGLRARLKRLGATVSWVRDDDSFTLTVAHAAARESTVVRLAASTREEPR